MAKLLFILKKREMTHEEGRVLWNNTEPRPYFKYCMSSGLRNSASFVVDMLNENGIEAKLVEVVDNNCIDKEVTEYKPTHVIIEAFWVIPEKFGVLTKLHPKVDWIVRNHSELPFLANEGIAIEWSLEYLKYKNVFLAPNSYKTYLDTIEMVAAAYSPLQAEYKVIYLPNFYKIKKPLREKHVDSDVFNVGCFGAIRPFKNHIVQAVAAIDYVRSTGKILKFHVNVARIEDAGNNTLKSLRGLFKHLDPAKYELVEHGWLSHDDFLKLVATMDICLQASFTESFNIVTADAVSQGVPVVVSEEIEWLPHSFVARHTKAKDITKVMRKVLFCFKFRFKAHTALSGLLTYNEKSVDIWTKFFK
jgi:glycosyltransferase involved in cell wall biosynthesis